MVEDTQKEITHANNEVFRKWFYKPQNNYDYSGSSVGFRTKYITTLSTHNKTMAILIA